LLVLSNQAYNGTLVAAVSGFSLTTIENDRVFALPALSVAVPVKLKVVSPLTDGAVPVIEPPELIVTPDGKPEATEYVIVAPESGSVAAIDVDTASPSITVARVPEAVVHEGVLPQSKASNEVAVNPFGKDTIISSGSCATVKS
jgi:hypothetical protein